MVTLTASLSIFFSKNLSTKKPPLAKHKAASHWCELIVLINE
jgi:hypothetical protein